MITQANLELVAEVVSEWALHGKMFTAYDVSREVQKRGGDQRHLTMRDAVHEVVHTIALPAGYTQEVIDIPGVPVPPVLYYKLGDDPSQYNSSGLALAAPITAQFDVNPPTPMLGSGCDCGHDHEDEPDNEATPVDEKKTGIAALWKRFWNK